MWSIIKSTQQKTPEYYAKLKYNSGFAEYAIKNGLVGRTIQSELHTIINDNNIIYVDNNANQRTETGQSYFSREKW
jgi:hypothetical protein